MPAWVGRNFGFTICLLIWKILQCFNLDLLFQFQLANTSVAWPRWLHPCPQWKHWRRIETEFQKEAFWGCWLRRQGKCQYWTQSLWCLFSTKVLRKGGLKQFQLGQNLPCRTFTLHREIFHKIRTSEWSLNWSGEQSPEKENLFLGMAQTEDPICRIWNFAGDSGLLEHSV